MSRSRNPRHHGKRDVSPSLRVRQALGKNIRYLRECMNMPQLDMTILYAAYGIGMGVKRVCYVENAKCDMNLTTVCKFASYWGVSIGDLLETDIEAMDKLREIDRRTHDKKDKDDRKTKRLASWG